MKRPPNVSLNAFSVRYARHCLLRSLVGSLLLACLGLNALASAQTGGPEAALRFRSTTARELVGAVARAEAELSRSRLGLSGNVELEPYYQYREDLLNPDNAPTLGPGFEVRAEADYVYDQADIVAHEIELLRVQEQLQDTVRDGVREALLTHAALLSAQFELRNARASLAAATRTLSETEAGFQDGSAGQTDLERARLDDEIARHEVTQADYAVNDARAASRFYNLDLTTATFIPLEFALPEAPVQDTFGYRLAERELQRTAAVALQDSVYGVLDEVRLGTRYRGENYEVSGGVSLAEGRPSVGADARYYDTAPELWTVTLGATIRLDSRTADTFSSAQRELAEAKAELAEVTRSFAEDTREARQEVAFERRSLELSLQDLELFDRRIAELETELRALPEALATLETQVSALEMELAALQARRAAATNETLQAALDMRVAAHEDRLAELATELAASEQQLAAMSQDLELRRQYRLLGEQTLYQNWTEYLTAVYDFLSLTDGGWGLATN